MKWTQSPGSPRDSLPPQQQRWLRHFCMLALARTFFVHTELCSTLQIPSELQHKSCTKRSAPSPSPCCDNNPPAANGTVLQPMGTVQIPSGRGDLGAGSSTHPACMQPEAAGLIHTAILQLSHGRRAEGAGHKARGAPRTQGCPLLSKHSSFCPRCSWVFGCHYASGMQEGCSAQADPHEVSHAAPFLHSLVNAELPKTFLDKCSKPA